MANKDEIKKDGKELPVVENLIKLAEDYGVDDNPLFTTTLERYITQIKTLEDLKKVIKDSDAIVTKEYVKGRENYYVHPAIQQYDRTTDSANKSVATLMKIIKSLDSDSSKNKDEDVLAELMDDDIDVSK